MAKRKANGRISRDNAAAMRTSSGETKTGPGSLPRPGRLPGLQGYRRGYSRENPEPVRKPQKRILAALLAADGGSLTWPLLAKCEGIDSATIGTNIGMLDTANRTRSEIESGRTSLATRGYVEIRTAGTAGRRRGIYELTVAALAYLREIGFPTDLEEAVGWTIAPVPPHASRRQLPPEEIHPEELNPARTYREGAATQVVVNQYERSRAARKDCIAKHGLRCAVCRIQFDEVYGDIGEGFIHVHHTKPLASLRQEYELNPEEDLIPVCPNCHAMLHSSDPPLIVHELQRRYQKLNPPMG